MQVYPEKGMYLILCNASPFRDRKMYLIVVVLCNARLYRDRKMYITYCKSVQRFTLYLVMQGYKCIEKYTSCSIHAKSINLELCY